MIPAQAVEAAARAIFISTGQYGVEWDDLDTYVKDRFRKDGTAALEAAAPHMSKPQQVASREELGSLEDPATILMDYCGHPYQWGEGMDGSEGWMAPHDQSPITSNHLWRLTPLTVLHAGGAL